MNKEDLDSSIGSHLLPKAQIMKRLTKHKKSK